MGKSTFISNFKYALVIDCDDGHKALESRRVTPQSWEDIEQIYALMALDAAKPPQDRTYHQVVIDTMTTFVQFASEAFCRQEGLQHEGEADWGKGTANVKGRVKNMITRFRNLGLGVVFVSHSHCVGSDKEGRGGKWVPRMNEEVFQLLDAISTASFYFRQIDTGAEISHVIETKPSSSWYAKDRHGIFPPQIPMDFAAFAEPINQRIAAEKKAQEQAEAEKKAGKAKE